MTQFVNLKIYLFFFEFKNYENLDRQTTHRQYESSTQLLQIYSERKSRFRLIKKLYIYFLLNLIIRFKSASSTKITKARKCAFIRNRNESGSSAQMYQE